MSELVFLDTNVLLYSISTDPSERRKREIARALIDERSCALSVQVLQEFFVQATRPTRDDPLSAEIARGFVGSWLRFPVQELTVALMQEALEVQARHRFSYWDSAIIAAARALGCATLYTEDLDHGRMIERMEIVNPFR